MPSKIVKSIFNGRVAASCIFIKKSLLLILTGLIGVWFLFVYFGLYFNGPSKLMGPNEIGDTLAGFAGTLALLWLVAGFRQQGEMLKTQQEELKNQYAELKNQRIEMSNMSYFDALNQIYIIVENAKNLKENQNINEFDIRLVAEYAESLLSETKVLKLYQATDSIENSEIEGATNDDWHAKLVDIMRIHEKAPHIINTYNSIAMIYNKATSNSPGMTGLKLFNEIRESKIKLGSHNKTTRCWDDIISVNLVVLDSIPHINVYALGIKRLFTNILSIEEYFTQVNILEYEDKDELLREINTITETQQAPNQALKYLSALTRYILIELTNPNFDRHIYQKALQQVKDMTIKKIHQPPAE